MISDGGHMTHSWMSDSNYGGEEKNTRPKEHLNYGEKNQNMRGDMEQPEKTEPTKTSSYNISPTGGNPNVNDDLMQRVVEALNQNLDIDSTDIFVNITDNDWVELFGTVPDREMIYLVDECVRALGIEKITNDIRVAR